ncbi:MAG: hypothetical protein U9N45_04450, partial [Gemmatimonadota bacterium]|nr:hypothetical protein [Gemmatimonadota bacterium]
RHLARIIHKISAAALDSLLQHLFHDFSPQRTSSTLAKKIAPTACFAKDFFASLRHFMNNPG